MSAPDTNTEKEAKRHKPALSGIAIAVIVAVLVGIVALVWGGFTEREQATSAPVETVDTE